MNRRRFLGVAAGLSATLAGCSGAGGTGTENKGDGAEQVAGDSEKVAAFVATLESKGVDVDSTMKIGGALSLMYFRRPDHERQDLFRIGAIYANNQSVSKGFLNLTALAPDGESRYGTYIIKDEWASGYANGNLTREQYLTKIESTFKET